MLALTTGCASITSGTTQSVAVKTETIAGESVKGVSCDMSNEEADYFVETPDNVTVEKSYSDLIIICKKEEHDDGIAIAKSSTGQMVWGNILIGGGIGAIIDTTNGAAYDYPTLIKVVMGQETTIEVPKEEVADKDEDKDRYEN